jgi:cytochrome c-type biogenesis protein CcmH/NrfF
MSIIKQSIFAVCILIGTNAALAETIPNEERGGLLYSTHCSTCHNSTIHWREQKLATDWNSLKAEVYRWQRYTKLSWSEQEIIDVTSYLNSHYYNFINPEPKILTIKNNESENDNAKFNKEPN